MRVRKFYNDLSALIGLLHTSYKNSQRFLRCEYMLKTRIPSLFQWESQYTQRCDKNKQISFSKLEIITYIFYISIYKRHIYILLAWVLWEKKQIAKQPQNPKRWLIPPKERWLIPLKVITTVISASDNNSNISPDIWNLFQGKFHWKDLWGHQVVSVSPYILLFHLMSI